ncbi:MAG: hypothetical protein RLZZ269_618, partial [Actinomycetota bacterium]
MRVLAAVDKFKGTASAHDVAQAIGHACWELGIDCDEVALADGGEGTLDVLGGPNRTSVVTGPLGDSVEASWRFHRGTAVIEMARASGLTLVGGPDSNDAIAASTTGTGELIDKALDLGAERIIVCLGGSATTDGGLGAVRAIHAPARLRGIEFVVACDVDTLFVDAAEVFAPQKGASPIQVRMLKSRLERLVQLYKETHGVDEESVDVAGDHEFDTAEPSRSMDRPHRTESAVGGGRSSEAHDDPLGSEIEGFVDEFAGAGRRRGDGVVVIGSADESEAGRAGHFDHRGAAVEAPGGFHRIAERPGDDTRAVGPTENIESSLAAVG